MADHPGLRGSGSGALLGGGLALTALGQVMLRDGRSVTSLAIWLAGLGAVVVAHRRAVAAAPELLALRNGSASWSPARLGLAAVAVAASTAVGALLWERSPSTDFLLVTACWIVAMVYLVSAAGWGDRGETMLNRPWTAAERWRLAAILVGSAALRVIHLGHFPTIVDGDGAAFALLARQVRDGTLRDPFTTGHLDHGTLFAFVQAGVTGVFGDTLAGVRATSALAGVAAVAVTYLLGRRLHGPVVAALAAAILAALPFHLYLSRVALNNVFDTLAVVALLYFLDRAFVDGSPADAALAGIVIGLAQYFYTGARVLAAVTVPIVLVAAWRRRRAGSSLRRSIGLGGWLVAGAFVAFLPLGLHYVDEPWDFTARTNAVRVTRDWISAEAERTATSELDVVARQGTDALLLPFATVPTGFWRPGIPLLGVPVAIPAAIGLAIAAAGVGRRRDVGVPISWWVSLALVALTTGVHGQRWTVGAPLAALAAGIGIEAVWNAARSILPARATRGLSRLVVATVAAIGMVNGLTYFQPRNALRLYGDPNSLIATDVARQLQDDEASLFMVTPPRMGIRSHPTIELLVPGFVGADVIEPLADGDDVPVADGPALYVLVPERRSELALIRQRCPGGEGIDISTHDGALLYTSYRVQHCSSG